MTLLEKILNYQQREGLSSEQFAKKVGVDASYWSLIKSGDRRLQGASKFLSGIMLNIPELRQDVEDYIRQGGDARAEAATKE